MFQCWNIHFCISWSELVALNFDVPILERWWNMGYIIDTFVLLRHRRLKPSLRLANFAPWIFAYFYPFMPPLMIFWSKSNKAYYGLGNVTFQKWNVVMYAWNACSIFGTLSTPGLIALSHWAKLVTISWATLWRVNLWLGIYQHF